MHDEKQNFQLFDLAKALVFRCHILHHTSISSNDLLCDKDAIIFNFHHASFDFPSMDLFLHDLNQAYITSELSTNEDTILRYLDYATIEQKMPMTAASMFWLDTLRDYKIDHSLPLPFDRYRLSDEYRTGREMSVSFDFGEDLSHVFLAYSSSNSITALQLALACYYAFLFKLTNGEKDLCIGMNTHGRYKEELMSVIGMFVNTIPLRCQLDPHWSFHQLVEHVKEIITNTLKYSYFPLQRILSQHPNATKPAFIETSFEFQSFKSKSDKKEMMIGNARIIAAPISKNIGEDGIMSNFDFTLTIQHDLDIDQLSCTINASLDLFDRKTIDIITQRFHSMLEQLFNVIGMMAIEIIGAVYCPLSPRDPEHRLHLLVEQTRSQLVLVHHLTKNKFNDSIISLDIDLVLIDNELESDINFGRLSNANVTIENVAYTIFTSGSTGMPKAAHIRHRNFSECIRCFIYIDAFNEKDTIVQMARCSFDVHVLDILGALMVGATTVMLRPGGLIDFEYLSTVLRKKQITYIKTVPSEVFPVKLARLMRNMVTSPCRIWNFYGPAEITIDCTSHVVDIASDTKSIPIERALPNYQCLLLDSWLQCVVIPQEGELYVGGVGVFVGYLGRDDLTARALIMIDGEIFYRTGDLVRMDNNGLLHYQGRKDHQIKLHGQRIELGETERCLLNTSISACVVIKWNDDHLIAYVQSTDINEEQLRKHCHSHLPPHMIPSLFIILDKLPLNANGKIDRKLLPAPQFSSLTNIDQTDGIPLTSLEAHLQRIFSEAFHNESPNVNMPFGQLGGTSLDAMRALVLIRQEIRTKVDANLLFANPSIRQLARVIEPLLVTYDDLSVTTSVLKFQEDQDRSMPSLCIEILGPVTSGYYPMNSYYYLHKLWLRQLIITSFHQALDFLPSYNVLSSSLLRWLGAHIEDDVKFAEFPQILRFPSNLLNIERGVTTFGGANLASFEMTKEGICCLDEIHLGSHTNLGNWCTIMPATRLPPKVIVGSLTLVTRKTVSREGNCVLLGIPAREMPFVMPENTSVFLRTLMSEFSAFVGPYLSGTQFLVFLFRMLGAQIGSDVILPDIRCLTDPHLVNVGDHVRLNMGAYIQAHTFEQRILKLAPITVNHSSVLMSNVLVLSGATLQGQNRILPWTLVIKDDQLPPNTSWSGVPAKQVI
ncbi:unnamed protein product [Rotaria sordida]|uniref:Carrier domain-containing protein n=1 Tax=Rotaria sordida TaxID=392033 RepID=A0A819IFB9_9BILA|nr:unnamed protein product [Rotaria sordida]